MRIPVASLIKKFVSTFFAATLVMGLVPAAAFAANDDTDAAVSENSQGASASTDIQAEAEAYAYKNGLEDLDLDVISSESEKSTLLEQNESEALTASRGEEETTANATGSDVFAITIPAATERINEDVMLTTPVAQQETTKNYFLAQTLESTRTVPIVSAQLPLDKGITDVEVTEPDTEGEGSNASEEEDGEDSNESDITDDPDDSVISTEASDSERSGEISTPVAAASTVVGSFTYRGITYAVEPGGETVAVVAADYAKLPEDFIEAKAIVLPSMVTADGIDYYTVTRIADYAFSSLTEENCRHLIYVAPDEEDAPEDEAVKDEDPNSDPETLGIDAITVPATVTEIGDNAYTDFNTLQYILVSEDNPIYGMYDGCLYDASLSQLRLIPEGRLGAVRVAPSVTEVTPEAFSHCPSVDTLVADPDSAAYQLLEGMNDIDKELTVEVGSGADVFTFTNLGTFETIEDTLACTRSVFESGSQGVSVLLEDGASERPDVLIRIDESFAMASLLSGSAYVSSFIPYSRVTSNASTTYTSKSSLPAWMQKAANEISSTNLSKITLYKASDYSTDQTIDSTGLNCFFTRNYGRYALASTNCNGKNVGDSVADIFGPTKWGNYTGITSEQIYQLRYRTTYGFYAYMTKGSLQGYHRPLVNVASTSATSGTVAKGTTVLRLDYSSATSPVSPVPSYKAFYFFMPPEFKINWDANGGSVSTSSWLVPTKEWTASTGKIPLSKYSSTLPTPTRTNYTFDGWYTAASGGSKISSSTEIDTEGITYYAHWTRDTYTVKYYNKAGTSVLNTDTVNVGDSYSLRSSPTASIGYTTKGWATSSGQTASTSGYGFNASKANWKSKGETLTLYLAETPNTYTVCYRNKADTATLYSDSYDYDQAFSLRGSPGSSTGYTAKGWATSKNQTAATSGYGFSASGKKNLTSTNGGTVYLYLAEAPNTYTLTVNPDGGTISGYAAGANATFTMTYDSANNYYIGNTFAKTGYTFAGLYTGTTQVYGSNGYCIKNTTYFNNSNFWKYANSLTVTAKWTAKESALTFDLKGANAGVGLSGTAPTGKKAIYNSAMPAYGNTAPTITGYTFEGFYDAKTGGTQYYTNTLGSARNWNKDTTNGTTLYGQWTANKYTVRYYDKAGTEEIATASSCTYDQKFNLASASASTGHTAKGWNTAANQTAASNGYGFGAEKINLSAKSGDIVNLYLAEEANKYDVTFKVRGKDGKWTESKSQYEYGGTIIFNYYMDSDKGWRFESWYYDEACTSKVQGSPSTTTMQPLTFYARWMANRYNATFNANGGTGGVKGPIEATYASEVPALPENWKPIREGYEFTGWWYAPMMTWGTNLGIPYYDADGNPNHTYDVAGDLEFKAGWSRWPFHAITLSDSRLDVGNGTIWYWPERGYTPFDVNGLPEDGSQDDKIKPVIDAKSTDRHIVDAPFCEDYEFLGYFDENDVQKIDENGNLLTEEIITDATIWYAKWERLGSAVELKANYGDMVAEDIVQGTDKIEHVAFGKDFATLLDGDTVTKIAQTPTRVGYTFMGYYTEPNPELSTEDVEKGNFNGKLWIYGENEYEVDVRSGDLVAEKWLSEEEWAKAPTNLVDKGAITLYAAWQLDDCIVTFDEQTIFDEEGDPKKNIEKVFVSEGSTALDNRIWHYNKNMSDKLPVAGTGTFTRNGYDFDGWYYLKDGTTVTRVSDKEGNPEPDVLLPWTDPVKEVTLYAYWTPKTYTLQFDPTFPNVEGVEEVYDGKDEVELAYDDDLTLVDPDFGAYIFDGWFVYGGLDEGQAVIYGADLDEVHMTSVVDNGDGTSMGRFTPRGDLALQTDEPIHVVAKWSKPEPKSFYLFVGAPGEVREVPVRQDAAREYDFAEVITFTKSMEPDWVPGWQFADWAMVDSPEEALRLAKSGAILEDEEAHKGFGPVTTKADYHDYYFVARWSACELSVKLADEPVENGSYVKGTDTFLNADSWNEVATSEDSNRAIYRVTDGAFTLPNLSRRGYDFKGWVREGDDKTEPELIVTVTPSQQAQKLEDYFWTFYPVFEEIEYTIVLEPNVKATANGKNGGYERQTYKKMFTDTFTFPYPTALNTGACFSTWSNEEEEPYRESATYKEFPQGTTWSLAPGTDDNGGATFGLTDLTDDQTRTIVLYGIWHAGYNVEVPLFANMAIDTETGDVAAGTATLRPKDTNDSKGVYQVESIRYEPVIDEETGQVPFQNEKNVYLSVYAGVEFQNADEGYYFLQRSKVDADTGEVSYTDKGGDSRKATPLLVKLGSTTPYLFAKEAITADPTPSYAQGATSLSDVTTEHNGFVPFKAGAQGGLSVRYGLLVAEPDADMKKTLKKYVFSEDVTSWTLPRNDAGYQRYTGLNEDAGRRLGWSSDTVDIAKLVYTVSRSEV